MTQKVQQGFTLVTAIFLLVVLAVLMVYMLRLNSVQHSVSAHSIQGARALLAARAGLEQALYGIYQSGSCASSSSLTFTSSEPALEDFSVDLSCSMQTHTEGSTAIDVYTVKATAKSGSYASGSDANPEYVSRHLVVTTSTSPP